MPHIKTALYGRPARLPSHRQAKTEIFQPIQGLHSGIAPQNLPPGFTNDCQNFVAPNGFLTIRSGLSKTGTFSLTKYGAFHVSEIFDAVGNLAGFAASERSFAFSHPDSPSWSTLSYQKTTAGPAGFPAGIDELPSGTSHDYWEAAAIYDKNSDKVITVASNNTNWMKWFPVEGSTETFSDFTWINSLDSMKMAKGVNSINDRLVFFNLESSVGTRFPQRVLWSARGGATDFILNNGAGFEDLVTMRGEGTGSIRFRDFLLLFTDTEIWRAQPTLDDYAFRFQRITDKVGVPWPRTAAATPLGVLFLSRDFEVYATDGSPLVVPVGPVQGEGPSRIQKRLRETLINPERSWAIYNQMERRYELYYATNDSIAGFPNEALYYNIDDKTWWPQKFPIDLSAGADLEDPSQTLTWDEATNDWDTYTESWNGIGDLQGNRWVTAFSWLGDVYSFRSDHTLDVSSPIDMRWQSHGLRQGDRMRKLHFSELWIDYESDDNSNATIFAGSAYSGHDYDSGTTVSFTTNGSPAFVPLWHTASTPLFELHLTKGSQVRIGGFQAVTKDAGRF
jgi:hypothetical protein